MTGGILTPWPAYLLHRGLATLPVRVRAQQASAEKVAAALAGHGLVKRVYYPGLAECDPLGLVGTQMSGPGSLMAFELATAEHAERIPAAVRMITHAVSLGGIDTLIQHPAGLTHRPVDAGGQAAREPAAGLGGAGGPGRHHRRPRAGDRGHPLGAPATTAGTASRGAGV